MTEKKLQLVEKGLECCSSFPAKCDECTYYNPALGDMGCNSDLLLKDALETITYLKKKQQTEVQDD